MNRFNTELPRALVDMDGVLADFANEMYRLVEQVYPDILLLDPMPDPPHFDTANNYPAKHYRTVRELSYQRGFFESLPVIDGALTGWERLMTEGFQPQICSAPIRMNPYSRQEKLAWLDTHLAPVFGSWVVETAIITREKYEFPGVVLIDDRPEIEHADLASWEQIVFDQPCNRQIRRPHFRLNGWNDPNFGTVLHEAAHIEQPFRS